MQLRKIIGMDVNKIQIKLILLLVFIKMYLLSGKFLSFLPHWHYTVLPNLKEKTAIRI